MESTAKLVRNGPESVTSEATKHVQEVGAGLYHLTANIFVTKDKLQRGLATECEPCLKAGRERHH